MVCIVERDVEQVVGTCRHWRRAGWETAQGARSGTRMMRRMLPRALSSRSTALPRGQSLLASTIMQTRAAVRATDVMQGILKHMCHMCETMDMRLSIRCTYHHAAITWSWSFAWPKLRWGCKRGQGSSCSRWTSCQCAIDLLAHAEGISGCVSQQHLFVRRFGSIEGIIRTFTGDGPEGMSGHSKHPSGMPYINCRAGNADEDRAGARGAGGAKRGRRGAKSSCTGCTVM